MKKKEIKEFKFEGDHSQVATAPYNFFHRTLGRMLAKRLYHTKITPNQLTFTGLIFLIISSYLFFRGDYISIFIAAFFVQVSHTLDCTDGKLARIRGTTSDYGAWLDEVTGTYGWLLVYLGITLGVYNQIQKPHVLIFGMLTIIASLLKNLTQAKFLTTLKFAKSYGDKMYKKLGFLMFFRYGGLFSTMLITFCAIFNKLYWFLLFSGIYGPIYTTLQNTLFTLKARKEFLKEKKIS